MIARALIVVLAVLNLGVAAWWLLRPEPAPASVPATPPGIAPLEIVRTLDAAAAPAPALQPAAPAHTCLRAGPFRSRAAANGISARLQPLLLGLQVEEEPGDAEMYRVLLPPVPSREEAEATVRRLRGAGVDDVLVLHQGGEANAVALGTFRNRDMAERRVAAMRQLGFPAELRTAGRATPPRWWLLLATARPEEVRAQAGEARQIDCSRIPGLADDARTPALESPAAPL